MFYRRNVEDFGVHWSGNCRWSTLVPEELCNAHISWDKTGGTQLLSVPKVGKLPRLEKGGILIRRPVPWNYYQNAVTSSYTFAWWNWKRWEKEIDWMAFQGINLPLAFTGQEAIWQKVFQMRNLHGWGGPLPQSWLDQQLDLQKKILARMHELGMTPGKSFIEQQLEEYGKTGHIYPFQDYDTFDENTPPDDNPNFISSLGASIFEGMKSGDKDAIWLMQALLHSVPIGRLVVFELFAEGRPIWRTSEQFYGLPYIWCMLHNFAGNIEMYGILDAVLLMLELVKTRQWQALNT
ncbi:hypothetical protein QQ045_028269 [Rhodiola kirilowii]